MASKLNLILARAAEASKVVTRNGSEYYKQLLEQNKHHVKQPPTVENCRLLKKQLVATRLASLPHRYETLVKEVDVVKGLWKNRKELKIEDAGIATLFSHFVWTAVLKMERIGECFDFAVAGLWLFLKCSYLGMGSVAVKILLASQEVETSVRRITEMMHNPRTNIVAVL